MHHRRTMFLSLFIWILGIVLMAVSLYEGEVEHIGIQRGLFSLGILLAMAGLVLLLLWKARH